MQSDQVHLGMTVTVRQRTCGRVTTPAYTGVVGQGHGEPLVVGDKVLVKSRRGVAYVSVEAVDPAGATAVAPVVLTNLRQLRQPAGGRPGTRDLRAAEQALDTNDFITAVACAERGVACGATGDDLGLLRLVQAEASMWCGELVAGEMYGVEAMGLLSTGSAAWFRAVTQAAVAAGRLGAVDRVKTRIAAALAVVPAPGVHNVQVTCLIRATHYLLNNDRVATEAIITRIKQLAGNPLTLRPQVAKLLHALLER